MDMLKNFLMIVVLFFIGTWYLIFRAVLWDFPVLSVLSVSLISFAITAVMYVVLLIILFRAFANNYIVTTDEGGNVSVGDNSIVVKSDGKVKISGNWMIGNGNEINVTHYKDND